MLQHVNMDILHMKRFMFHKLQTTFSIVWPYAFKKHCRTCQNDFSGNQATRAQLLKANWTLNECQDSATLLMMTAAYLAMDDSGDCWSLPITGNKGDERMNCLQSGCAHIFAMEKRAIFKGDSLPESFLLGFNANTAQSEINFSRDCKGKRPYKTC